MTNGERFQNERDVCEVCEAVYVHERGHVCRKVYHVVQEYDFGSVETSGRIFSTRRKAEERRSELLTTDANRTIRIDELVVDEESAPEGCRRYLVKIYEDRLACEMPSEPSQVQFLRAWQWTLHRSTGSTTRWFEGTCWARDEDHAITVARAAMSKSIAAGDLNKLDGMLWSDVGWKYLLASC